MASNNPNGKPAQFSTQQIIAELEATNGLVSLAAKNLGCCTNTIYNRAKQVKSVQAKIDECRNELVDRAELALRKCIEGNEAWAVALVLKTLGKDRGYVEKHELEIQTDKPLVVIMDR